MATRAASLLIRAARSGAVELSDCDLLTRYVQVDDHAAFATVIGRHSAMVLGVCRRLLPSSADAEDACQAVFLILARKAKSTRWQPSVANWLYATARKVAQNARLASARRRRREGVASVPESVAPVDRMSGRELTAALDEELDKLPPRYREPLVLCYLEGLTRDEAATRLGVPLATLKKQLERGRKKLADALTARGYALGISLLATFATSPSLASSPRLLESILAAVDGAPSASVAALAKGVVVNGLLIRTKMVLVAVLGTAVLGLGVGTVPSSAEPQKPAMEKPAAKGEAKPDKPKLDVKERTISGTVVGSDGKPVVAELALHWTEGTVQPLGKTNPDGTFKLTVPFQKKNMGGELVATAAGCGPDFHHHGYNHMPASVTPNAELAFTLPKERAIKGRIINQEGKPVAGATVATFDVCAYDSGVSLDTHLKNWAQEALGNPLHGDRGMQYPKSVRPPSVTTDKDGRFELRGFGAGQVVKLKLSGDGIAVKGLMCVNRDGFDPAPLIQAAIGNAAKDSKFNARWLPYGPDFTAVVEREKLIRGRVTDHEGKSRVGVRVSVTRTTRTELTDHWYWHEATTDRDGKYEIRGLRKYPAYTVDVDGDPKSGQLPLQVSSQDTAWYEPITLDAKSARGVVVSGRVTNKATGQPVPGTVDADVMPDNPFVVKYPTLLESSHSVMRTRTDADGGFRLVVLPGRVLVMFRPDEGRTEYRPPQPDPDHATLFHPSADGVLVYDSYAGGRGIVQGNWCKVLETKPTDTEVAVNVELEPATITLVNVVDADGKPVIGAKATGLTHSGFDRSTDVPGRDTLTVFNLEGKKERMLAVIHVKRKLVGTLTLTADAKNPVVKLGTGGSVTGKAVGADGKPLAGLTVELTYPRREARAASDLLKKAESIITDANGEFRIDTLFPGQEFQLSFSRGKKQYGPGQAKAPKHTLAKHGDTLKLGDLTLDAAKDGD